MALVHRWSLLITATDGRVPLLVALGFTTADPSALYGSEYKEREREKKKA